MAAPHATVNGLDLQRCELRVPWSGVPWADVVFAEATELPTGTVTLRLGSLTMIGTVDPKYSGAFGAARSARIVAGAGGWGVPLPPRPYHADNGVSARMVASDAARDCGETLGDCTPGKAKLGLDWSRPEGAASVTIEAAAGGVPWWVGLDGVTRIGARTETAITGAYSLLTYSPRSHVAVLSVDDPADVQVGSLVADRLDVPMVAREVSYDVTPEAFRVRVWLGGDTESGARVVDAVRKLVDRAVAGRLWGLYRYRVVAMAGVRASLQAVSTAAGVPDQVACSQRPGIPGAWGKLTGGSEVLVQFVAGDPGQPVITGFGPLGDPESVPVELDLAGGTLPVARVGDTITTFFPPAVPISGTLDGVPFVGVITITTGVPGIIGSGSGIVRVG